MESVFRLFIHYIINGIIGPFIACFLWLFEAGLIAEAKPLNIDFESIGQVILASLFGCLTSWWILVIFASLSFIFFSVYKNKSNQISLIGIMLVNCIIWMLFGVILGIIIEGSKWILYFLTNSLVVGILLAGVLYLLWVELPRPKRYQACK